jgi:putative membrane protein
MSTDPQNSTAAPGKLDKSTELSMRRTGMSFQRTRMSADRTLMSVQRTSLSLIGFGFTIFNFFRALKAMPEAKVNMNEHAPRNFGMATVVLGIALLAVGIWQNVDFLRHLRAQREEMRQEGLIFGESKFPFSVAQVSAMLVLLLGLYAVFSMTN